MHDGAVQYIENSICEIIDNLDDTYNNVTKQTNGETVNQYEMSYCDDYVIKSLDMLYVLGLDLFKKEELNQSKTKEIHTIKKSMEKLYTELVEEVKILNKDIIFIPTKTYIKASIDKQILFSVESFNNYLSIIFNAKLGSLLDSSNILEDVSNLGHHGPGEYRLKLSDNLNLNKVIDFINQIINL